MWEIFYKSITTFTCYILFFYFIIEMNDREKNFFVKIMLEDLKIIKGELIGIDKHMNMVLHRSNEFRNEINVSFWEKRFLGLCVIRGDSIISFSLTDQKTKKQHHHLLTETKKIITKNNNDY
mmetsp:Transcript_37581/g.94237  ORF Transcript_37581/g.94237 Transcript_37581/m.94237 type:complete len:122 (+) Transcript_37581:457-822(+)